MSRVRDRPGKLIAGRYELVEPAGEGGMAVVWRAFIRGAGSFARPVAVKRIHAAKNADRHFIKLFEEEARVGAALHHPNVVQILDFGVDEQGDYFLVMEWMDGLDLHEWVRSHPRSARPPWPLVAAIAAQVLRGLKSAHERIDERGQAAPVIHRDVSPSNILLGANGSVKLTDFGLARATDRASMTRPNVIKGKLAYCAPELVTGSKVSAQSDLFALGVVLWESLAQRRMFTGKNDLEILMAVKKREYTPLPELRDDLPPALVALIDQALAEDPEHRFESAAAMARAVASILHAHPHPIDEEAIGLSVAAARQRLGKAKAKSLPQDDLTEELSLAELRPADAQESTIHVSVEVEAPQTEPKALSIAPAGVWSDEES